MRRILNNVLCKALCLALLACATLALSGGAMAAEGPLVLVLPFQVNAGPELPNASQDLPQMIADQLGIVDADSEIGIFLIKKIFTDFRSQTGYFDFVFHEFCHQGIRF